MLTLCFFDRDHIAELQNAKPKKPFFFLKPPSSIVLPGEGPCLQPKGVDMHFEVELALIIGSVVKNLHPEDEKGALDAIKGEFELCCIKLPFIFLRVLYIIIGRI